MTLTKTELIALKDCDNWRLGSYVWRPATMRKLAAKGLVELWPTRAGSAVQAYVLTEAGRAALAEGGEG